MTLAEATEPDVVRAVHDPATALLAAEQRGLLVYHGFVAGNRYEIRLAGQELLIAGDQVLLLVDRLEAIHELAAAGAQARLAGVDSDRFVLEIDGRTAAVPGGDLIDWCRGYRAALVGRGQQHAGEDQLGQIAGLLDNPTRDDQCRFVVLGLMKGGPAEIGSRQLAKMIGDLPGVGRAPSKKTIGLALAFGPDSYWSGRMAEQLIAALGYRWSVSGSKPVVNLDGSEVTEPLPELPQLVLLRRILAASRAGYLRYVDQPSPNLARWKREFELTIGQQSYVIPTEQLGSWLDGVFAFHAGDEPAAGEQESAG